MENDRLKAQWTLDIQKRLGCAFVAANQVAEQVVEAIEQARVDGRLDRPSFSRETFTNVVVLFLQDWQAGRVTADELCQTLLAAARARGIARLKRDGHT
jgi:hypothetical protein